MIFLSLFDNIVKTVDIWSSCYITTYKLAGTNNLLIIVDRNISTSVPIQLIDPEEDTSLRDFAQGAFRMRQLGKGQTVTILVTPEARLMSILRGYTDTIYVNLVGGLVAMNFIFPYIGNFIIPIDVHFFQRGSNHQPDNIYCYESMNTIHR